MAHSLTSKFPAYNPKRSSKMPHRRATIDVASPSSQRPCIKPSIRRRLSLPPLRKSVQFSQLSEVCVIKLQPKKIWYTGEDHQRFKRERISDVVSFRLQSRQNTTTKPQAAPPASTGGSASGDRSHGPSSPSPSGPANPATSGSSCPVGLEQLLSNQGMNEAHSARKTVIQQVLLEQHRQRCCGYQDPLSIAIVSVRLSATACEGAVKRGKFQEMAKFV